MDGTPVATGAEALARIERAAPGTSVLYTFLRSGGSRFDLVVPTVRFTWRDAAWLFAPFLIGGFLLVVLTGFVAVMRPLEPPRSCSSASVPGSARPSACSWSTPCSATGSIRR